MRMETTINKWTDPDGNKYYFKDEVARAQNRETIKDIDIERKRIDNLLSSGMQENYDTAKAIFHSKANGTQLTGTDNTWHGTNPFTNITDSCDDASDFYTKNGNTGGMISISKPGTYLFIVRYSIKATTEGKRGEFGIAIGGKIYEPRSFYFTARNVYYYSTIEIPLYIGEESAIEFKIRSVDSTSIEFKAIDTELYAIDWENKVKIPELAVISKELQDIRTAADATTYDSAGAAVRGQIKKLTDIIDLTFTLSSSVLKSTTFSVKASRKLAIIIPEGMIVYYYYRPGTSVAYKYSEGKIQRFNLNAGEQQHFEIRRESKDITSKTYLELMLIPRIL